MPPSYLFTSACLAAVLTACTSLSSAPQSAAGAPAAAPAGAAPAWPHETSDVRPDPAVRYGRLPNGMRYAIRHNKTPPKQALMRLRFDVGSLVEQDDQLGLAHFMEHMIFNGTQNVPEGEFTKRLERLGMQFGRDINAGTGHDQTTYMFNLPDTRPEILDTGLMLLREAADKALIETAAIERERGVVLSEERTRDSAGFRASMAGLDFFLKDMLPPKRMPIGNVEILKTAPRERFKAFYEAYYRPENAVLAVVGDIDPAEIERKIVAQFSDWRGEGPAGPRPDLGVVPKRGLEVGTYVEAGVPSSLTLAWQKEPELDPDSRAERRKKWRRAIVLSALNRRLGRLTLRDNPPFVQASASSSNQLKAIRHTSIGAAFAGNDWRRTLQTLEQEQRRIVQYGVTQAELDREITAMREGLKNGVQGASTRSSGNLMDSLLLGVGEDQTVTTPEDQLALFEETVATFSPQQASEVVQDLFQGYGPLVFVTSPTAISGGEAAIADAFQQSTRLAVAPPLNIAPKAWAYTDFGTPGQVVERREITDLGTTFVRFANGVRLTVRPSQVDRASIGVSVRAGDGMLDLPLGKPSIEWGVREALVEGGLGRLTAEEVSDALAGKSYFAGAGVGEDAFELFGSTRPADFATQMQVLTAFMKDPGWRPQGLERRKSRAANEHQQMMATPGGVLGRDLPRLLRSGDPRFGTAPLAAIEATTIADVRKALRPILEEPIEVIITGDTSVEEAIRQTAATFGALPPRRERAFPPASARTPFPKGNAVPVRLTHQGRADQSIAFLAWPTDDEPSDLQKERIVSVLTSIMRLRLTDELRENQAVTYSPGVSASSSWAFPDYGFISASILVDPARLDSFFADTLKIARALREAPVTEDELKRALGPIVESLRLRRESNGYWANALAGAQTDPRRLADIRESIAGMQRITPADIQRVAREYLREDKAYRLVVLPEAKKTASR